MLKEFEKLSKREIFSSSPASGRHPHPDNVSLVKGGEGDGHPDVAEAAVRLLVDLVHLDAVLNSFLDHVGLDIGIFLFNFLEFFSLVPPSNLDST